MKTIKRQEDNLLFTCIFIAVLFSSMLGMTIGGISLNKIALLPLEIYLLYKLVVKRETGLSPDMYPLILFYLVQLIGSWFALVSFKDGFMYEGFQDKLVKNIIQVVFIYTPVVISIGTLENKTAVYEYLKKAVVYTARFQCAWAILQFLLWNINGFDLNGFLFVDLLKGAFGESFRSVLLYIDGRLQIRAVGINYEAASFALIMLLGTCFEKRTIIKFFYLFACLLGMTRTGVVAVGVVLFAQLLLYIRKNIKKDAKKTIRQLIILLGCGIVLFLILYICSESIRVQVNNVIDRFLNMQDDDGSDRHIMYPIYCVYSWLFDLNTLQKLFGFGARVSGLVFVRSPYVSSIMSFYPTMLTTAWDVECDIAATLLGNGIIGFVSYLLIIYKLVTCEKEDVFCFGAGVFIYGFMYNTFQNTLVQIVLILLFASVGAKKSYGKKQLCFNYTDRFALAEKS